MLASPKKLTFALILALVAFSGVGVAWPTRRPVAASSAPSRPDPESWSGNGNVPSPTAFRLVAFRNPPIAHGEDISWHALARYCWRPLSRSSPVVRKAFLSPDDAGKRSPSFLREEFSVPAATRREPYAVRDSRHMPTVTPTVHLSAAVTFFQSPSPSFSSVATASWAFPSNCLASASVFAPMDVLPFSSGVQPAPLVSVSTEMSNEAGRNRHWPVPPRTLPLPMRSLPRRGTHARALTADTAMLSSAGSHDPNRAEEGADRWI